MSILVNKNSRVMVQGVTGHEGLFHTKLMYQYGTAVVAGITPGRGGDWLLDGKIPIFDSAKVAVEATGAEVTVLFVPARAAPDAMYEAADAGIKMIICITEGIPVQDMMRVRKYLEQKSVRLIGPNCPGIITPGEVKVGIIPGNITKPGPIGVVSRSGTLTYEVLFALQQAGLGTTTCVGIGGDTICGTSFTDVIEMFDADPHTQQIVMIGEIGGTDEENAADLIARSISKPVIAFIAGQTAPPGRRMGHAGAIIEGGLGTASEKVEALRIAGVRIARYPEEIPALLSR